MKRRMIGVLVVCSLLVGRTAAQDELIAPELLEEIEANVNVCGNSFLAYPIGEGNVPSLTRAPRGYKPFYISHYGRHGSRWLASSSDYDKPVEVLRKAATDGMLTAQGQTLLTQLEDIRLASQKRTGELTPLGARQHQEIARRMVKNFPEVFGRGARVDCKSSTVMRCALSMANEAATISKLCPDITVTTDASAADMVYVAPPIETSLRDLERGSRETVIADYYRRHMHVDHLMGELFTDASYVRDSIDVNTFVMQFSDLASNQQSHNTEVSLWPYLNRQEAQEVLLRNNAQWYVVRGASPITQGRMPEVAHSLLQKIIVQADSVIAAGGKGASLRFGHDSNLMPLAVLLELDNTAAVIDSMEDVTRQGWVASHVVPMAGNVQLIFYRSRHNDEILVKALLNEHEATLPVRSDLPPYYRWSDLREYYLAKIKTKD